MYFGVAATGLSRTMSGEQQLKLEPFIHQVEIYNIMLQDIFPTN